MTAPDPTTPRCPTCGSRYYDQFVWWTFPVGEVRKASCIPGAFDPWHTESLEVGARKDDRAEGNGAEQVRGRTAYDPSFPAAPTSENLATVREALTEFHAGAGYPEHYYDEDLRHANATLDALEQELAQAREALRNIINTEDIVGPNTPWAIAERALADGEGTE